MGAMELAALVGISIMEFWELTPLELNVAAKGYARRQEQQQKLNIYQAYLISRLVWQKKVDIKKLLGEKKAKKVMTDDEMLDRVMVLNKLFGGEIVKRQ